MGKGIHICPDPGDHSASDWPSAYQADSRRTREHNRQIRTPDAAKRQRKDHLGFVWFLGELSYYRFSTALRVVHSELGASLGIKPLDPQTKAVLLAYSNPDSEDSVLWVWLLEGIGEPGSLHLCAHLACRESTEIHHDEILWTYD